MIEAIKTEIEGVFILKPKIFEDGRGYFFEAYSKKELEKAIGQEVDFVQDNESKSSYGVVRGLHYQTGEFAQAKLVRVVKGRVLDVAVDIRKDSPTYGKHIAVELSEDNHLLFFIPRGLAHGFSVLSPEAIFQYKCDNYYSPEHEGHAAWNDPLFAIDWKIPNDKIILSEKDKKNGK